MEGRSILETPSTADKLRFLAGNLASAWNGGGLVLDRLMDASGHLKGPTAILKRMDASELEPLFGGDWSQALDAAVQSLSTYLTAKAWFDRVSKNDPVLSSLISHPVAYFCAEYGLNDWLPIYSGGLGVLAGDVLKEASDLAVPLVGVGLLYRHGFFSQRLDARGYQREIHPTVEPVDLPLTLARGSDGEALLVEAPMANGVVYVQAWQLQVGRVSLYLLDTGISRNTREEDRGITDSLYGGDAETRIRQELVLGIGGVRMLRKLGIDPAVYSMNEGHAAFLALELLTGALENASFEAALARTRSRIVYTNHTVVPAGNDVFSGELVRKYVAPYAVRRGLSEDRLRELGGGPDFSMAILAFHLSGKANAVSEIHARAIHDEHAWSRFPVESVTNGVHVPTWLGDGVRSLLDRFVPNWQAEDASWEDLDRIPPWDLWEARRAQRRELLRFVDLHAPESDFDEDTLTVVWARRFAEYKRAGLLATDLGRLASIMSRPGRNVQLIISGKAHPKDEEGKRIMRDLLADLRSNAEIAPRFAFIPDYSIRVARKLVAGADVWLNTPRKPLEASGTSGMKSSDNGGLQLTVEDGWAAEVDWQGVGWGLPGYDDREDAHRLHLYLEQAIVPAFYQVDESGVPAAWVEMMKRSMRITLSRYSARRMVEEYVQKLYLPLLKQQNSPSALAGFVNGGSIS